MDINPFGGETPVNKVLPSDGGLVFENVAVFGKSHGSIGGAGQC